MRCVCVAVASLLLCSALRASVRVTPDRSVFSTGDRVFLDCEDRDWTVRRNTSAQTKARCGVDWGATKGISCYIFTLAAQDSGWYWCESREGRASDRVNIRVKDKHKATTPRHFTSPSSAPAAAAPTSPPSSSSSSLLVPLVWSAIGLVLVVLVVLVVLLVKWSCKKTTDGSVSRQRKTNRGGNVKGRVSERS